MLLNVHSCRPRLALAAAAQQGTLIAGQKQWLGIIVQPLHDRLDNLCLHLACVRHPGSSGSEWTSIGSDVGLVGSPTGRRSVRANGHSDLDIPLGSEVHCIPLHQPPSTPEQEGAPASADAAAAATEGDQSSAPRPKAARPVPAGMVAVPDLPQVLPFSWVWPVFCAADDD